MSSTLSIKNFKGIKEGQIDLAPLTILIGSNNSGKSTILEALFLLPNPFRRVPYSFSFAPEATALSVLHEIHETLNSEGYKFLFHDYSNKSIEISYRSNKLKEDVKLDIKYVEDRIIGDVNLDTTKSRISIGGAIYTILGSCLDYTRTIHGPYQTEPYMDNSMYINSNLIKPGYAYLQRNWISIINQGICKKAAQEASELSHDKYENITIEPFLRGNLSAFGYFKEGKRIRLGDLGEGIQNYLISKILFLSKKHDILLWDDVESHLNPRIILNLSHWFSDLIDDSKQIVITSHSIEAIRTIADMNRENVSIYLTMLDNGILKTKKFSADEIDELLESGIDVRVAERFMF